MEAGQRAEKLWKAIMEQVSASQDSRPLREHEETVPGSASPGDPEVSERAKEITVEIERFSKLSSDLAGLLSDLSQKFLSWMSELQSIQSEVERKKKELKLIHDIEASYAALEKLIEEQRLRKESFESLMENQRRLWEEEKAQRLQQDKEYQENLRIQRQKEEEEYRRKQELEREQARQLLEEELHSMRAEAKARLEAWERELSEREAVLKTKESEWNRLVEELEQFMSRITARIHSNSGPS